MQAHPCEPIMEFVFWNSKYDLYFTITIAALCVIWFCYWPYVNETLMNQIKFLKSLFQGFNQQHKGIN